MSFCVILSPQAEADFRGLYNYIEDHSPSGAERWRASFYAAIERMKSQPLTCGLAPESSDFPNDEIRQVLFRTKSGLTYRALFVIRQTVVHVLRVRGPGQDLVDIDDLPEWED